MWLPLHNWRSFLTQAQQRSSFCNAEDFASPNLDALTGMEPVTCIAHPTEKKLAIHAVAPGWICGYIHDRINWVASLFCLEKGTRMLICHWFILKKNSIYTLAISKVLVNIFWWILGQQFNNLLSLGFHLIDGAIGSHVCVYSLWNEKGVFISCRLI